jgi:hypothetical protein
MPTYFSGMFILMIALLCSQSSKLHFLALDLTAPHTGGFDQIQMKPGGYTAEALYPITMEKRHLTALLWIFPENLPGK